MLFLLIFLLSIAAFTLGSLYFELKHKHQLLIDEVAQLKASQILFMVPDAQAEVMANWMVQNPTFVQPFAEQAREGQVTTMSIGDSRAENSSEQVNEHDSVATKMAADIGIKNKVLAINTVKIKDPSVVLEDTPVTFPKKVQKVSVAEDGVKLISLPDGGIRITTRALEE